MRVRTADLHRDTRTAAELGDHQRVLLHDALVDLQELLGVSRVQRHLQYRRNTQPSLRYLLHYVTGDTYRITPTTRLYTLGLLMKNTNYGRSMEWGRPLYFHPMVSFYLCSFFSSPNLSGRTLDVYHTSTHGVALVRI